MIEKEILDGLKKTKDNKPNATIGIALEQMMGLDLFWHDKYLTEGGTVCANIPQNCRYTVEDIAGVIGCIGIMVREQKLYLLGEDLDYGEPTMRDLKRLNVPGSISPIQGSDITTWKILSNHFEITNH